MKKLTFFLIIVFMIHCFVGCQINGDSPASTTGTPTDLPTGAPTQTPKLTATLIEPGKTENWREVAAFPDALPEQTVDYTVVLESSDFSCENALIKNTAELHVYFNDLKGVKTESRTAQLYTQLKDIDFSKYAVLFLGDTSSYGVTMKMDRIAVHNNGMIVVYESSYTGGIVTDVMTPWGFVLLLEKSDLPATGESLSIYACATYPTWDEVATQPRPEYPATVYYPERYVFREMTE